MAFTFKGTYTKNRGDQAAAGTVEILSKRGVSLATATLDENGSYEEVISAQEGEVTVVETITGVAARSYPVSVSRGSTTDTSRDVGYVGPSAGGGGGVSPMAAAFTTEEIDDPIGGGTMTAIIFPAEQTALAIKMAGDDYPRIILGSDSSDGIVMGDGTFDPYGASGAFVGFGAGLRLQSPAANPTEVKGGFRAPYGIGNVGGGLQVKSPDGTWHRILVADDGTVSTDVVA